MYVIGISIILLTVFMMFVDFKNWLQDYIETTLSVRMVDCYDWV